MAVENRRADQSTPLYTQKLALKFADQRRSSFGIGRLRSLFCLYFTENVGTDPKWIYTCSHYIFPSIWAASYYDGSLRSLTSAPPGATIFWLISFRQVSLLKIRTRHDIPHVSNTQAHINFSQFTCLPVYLYCIFSCYISWTHPVIRCLHSLCYMAQIAKWLRLALSKRPNRVGVFLPSSEDGNRSSFRNDAFPSF
jgi:hypothetical protein